MTDNELIVALSNLFDKKLAPINARLDSLENNLQQVKLKMDNDIVPRLQNIESCYTTTYDRYKNGTAEIEGMKEDISVIKKVIVEHSEKLKKIS